MTYFLIILVAWIMIGMISLYYVRNHPKYGHRIKASESRLTAIEVTLYYIVMVILWPTYMITVLK